MRSRTFTLGYFRSDNSRAVSSSSIAAAVLSALSMLNSLARGLARPRIHYSAPRTYVEMLFTGEETIAPPWAVILGFLRIATNTRLFQQPLPVDQAVATVDSWLAQPPVVAKNAGDEHWQLLKQLLSVAGAAGKT
ncbi:MAG: hypothetical protein ACT4P6_15130 [Gemmatimonadaceae bacterium]